MSIDPDWLHEAENLPQFDVIIHCTCKISVAAVDESEAHEIALAIDNPRVVLQDVSVDDVVSVKLIKQNAG